MTCKEYGFVHPEQWIGGDDEICHPINWKPIYGDPGSAGLRDDAGFGV